MYVLMKTCKCFFLKKIYPNVQLFFIDLCSMPCLSESCNAKETKADDLKVAFNHILSSWCLFWDLSVFFLCSHVYFLISFSCCHKMAIFHFYLPERLFFTSVLSQFIQDSVHHHPLRLQKLNRFLIS